MPVNQIILVGQCSFDTASLYAFIQQNTDTPIKSAHNNQDLANFLSPDSLLLINRVLPAAFDTDSGVELITKLSNLHAPSPRMILISDLPDAQQQAEEAGALPGFGKSQLNDDLTTQRFHQALQ